MTDPTPELRPEETEALRERLAAPPPPSGVLDAARAAAMDAFDEIHEGEAPTGVRDIRSARSTSWYQRIPLGAAAAVLALVAVVGVATQIDLGGDDDMAASSADETSMEDSGGLDDEASRDAAGALESDSAPLAPESDLATASYDDIDTLIESYRGRFGTNAAEDGVEPTASTTTRASSGATADDDESFATCDAANGVGVSPLDVVTFEYVNVQIAGDDTAVIVVLYESEETRVRIAVLDEASCTLLDDRVL
ncbi:hypothetical protein [Actinospongicola halichondriae]|uniref:hypothetical protein n=1 Tax=Actinospongicola halichondriae TaxID=3236844 RepID=UPI003D38C9A6